MVNYFRREVVKAIGTCIQDTGMEMDSVVYIADKCDWDNIRLRDYQESDRDIQELTFNNNSTKADLKILVEQTTIRTSFIRENGKWYLSDYTSFD